AEAHADRSVADAGAVHRGRDRESAVAPAAADALEQQAGGTGTFGEERAVERRRHAPGVAAGAAVATQADRDRAAADARPGARDVDRKPAVAAAAADRLHDHAFGAGPDRVDRAVEVGVDDPARPAAGALAAQPDADAAVADARGIQGNRDVEAAVAAAATHALDEHAVRVGARRRDDRVHHRDDGAAGPADGTVAAESHPDRAAADPGACRRHVDVETAVAAAAADRLHDDAAGVVARGFDAPVDVAVDGAARAAAVTGAADADGDRAAADTGRGHARRDVEAAVAAATADALVVHADSVVTGGDHGGIHRGRHRVAVAAGRAFAADADADRAVADAGDRHRRRDVETAVAAATADRLRENARGRLTAGVHAAGEVHVDGAGRSPGAALTADPDGDRTAADRIQLQGTRDGEAAVAA